MLKCPKCGTDNLLSAVFCRGCGEKLNLDEIKPDDFQNIGVKKVDHTLQNAIGGAIIGVLILVFAVGCLFPAFGKLSSTEDEQKAAADKIAGIAKGATITLTDAEATAFVTGKLKSFSGTQGDPTATGCTVHFLDGNTVKLLLSGKVGGFLPISVTVLASIQASNKAIDLTMTNSKLGLFPIPEALKPKIIDNFRTVFNSCLSASNEHVKAIAVSAGQISITRTGKSAGGAAPAPAAPAAPAPAPAADNDSAD
jgi:hypothetical protein